MWHNCSRDRQEFGVGSCRLFFKCNSFLRSSTKLLFQHHSSWFWCPQECNHKPFDHPQGGHRATNLLEPTFLIFSVFHMVRGCCVGSRLFDGRPQTVSPWHWLSYFRVNLSNTLYKKYKVPKIQSTEYKFKHCCYAQAWFSRKKIRMIYFKLDIFVLSIQGWFTLCKWACSATCSTLRTNFKKIRLTKFTVPCSFLMEQ